MNSIQYVVIVLSAVLPAYFYYDKYTLSVLFFMALFAIALTYIAMYYIEPIFYIGSDKTIDV